MPAGGSRAVIQRKGAHWQQHLAQKVVTAEHVTVPDGHPESAAPELRERCWELWGGEGGGSDTVRMGGERHQAGPDTVRVRGQIHTYYPGKKSDMCE